MSPVSLLREESPMFFRVCASVAIAAGLLCTLTAAAAEEKKAPDFDKIFKRKDTNADGMLSLEEFKTGLKDKALETADKRFGKSDSNADGKLSLDEFKAGMTPRKK
jgi:Ca2+-binding EF-hand superfamily protein